jgi:hypothetical protein
MHETTGKYGALCEEMTNIQHKSSVVIMTNLDSIHRIS